MKLILNGTQGRFFCIARPLHVATPLLALELIKHGADPNFPDSEGWKPLDWVIHPLPGAPRDPAGKGDSAWLYEMCQVLVKAGGTTSPLTPRETWMDMLAHFEGEGYETQSLHDWYFRYVCPHETPRQQALSVST
ncbi:hypothetical protein B0T25DRAFT_554051 [Lasiosphaeria hispida]|uniref:Ankyrin repeat protein n=1 Tax=Lasiosphaeria hispida TaxID=260671 RepID=A0AAJ0MBG9_9PEZI|nr:hypothetical protein B0T25DRAFT_554051 [Lasiosphaeria hispida]